MFAPGCEYPNLGYFVSDGKIYCDYLAACTIGGMCLSRSEFRVAAAFLALLVGTACGGDAASTPDLDGGPSNEPGDGDGDGDGDGPDGGSGALSCLTIDRAGIRYVPPAGLEVAFRLL